MRFSSTSNGASNMIGRRRGASRRKAGDNMVLNQKSILVLAALCATIFSTGLIVGTRLDGSGSGGINGRGAHKQAESSPLAAATSKMAPSDIQNLILESARAEAIVGEERTQHAVDGVVNTEEGAGDGALYLYAGGDEGEHDHGDSAAHQKGDDMRNHLLESLKAEKDSLVELGHREWDKAKDAAKKVTRKVTEEVKRGLRGHRGGGESVPGDGAAAAGGVGSGGDSGAEEAPAAPNSDLPTYPYMISPVPSDYDFKRYEPLGGSRFVEYKDGDAPYDLTSRSLMQQSDEMARSRRVHVKNAMKHIWRNYKEHAFGRDEMHPISARATSNWGGMGTTLVDSLDTLWLMGMKDEFWEGRDWVRDHLSHDHVGQVSVFETTIRSLGGLLAAYDLSGDDVFLKKADDLGSRLLRAYDIVSGLPHGRINLSNGQTSGNRYILAEVATQQVEYRYLARKTGKDNYERKSDHVFKILHRMQPADGLLSENIGGGGKVSFGAMGDSAYEYMLKVWVQGGRKEDMYREMWDKAMMGVHSQLVQKTHPNDLTFLADRWVAGQIDRKMDHLACFMGGALALGAYTDPMGLDSDRAKRDLRTARALTYTCYQMYARTNTGIAPEFMKFSDGEFSDGEFSDGEFSDGAKDDMQVPGSGKHYILRPETVEAFYYLNKLTGDPIYREWGWEVFQSIEKYCKTRYGYGSLKDVNRPGSVEDKMESFFMAETLKYLYLLFDPDSEIDPLNKHVFNTEAHPVSIFND